MLKTLQEILEKSAERLYVQSTTFLPSVLAAVVIALQLATSPVSSHMVARSAYRYGHLDPGSLVVDELSRDIDAGVVERPGSGGERQRADPADGAGPRPGRLSGSDSTTR